jgi:hypothetical protein
MINNPDGLRATQTQIFALLLFFNFLAAISRLGVFDVLDLLIYSLRSSCLQLGNDEKIEY